MLVLAFSSIGAWASERCEFQGTYYAASEEPAVVLRDAPCLETMLEDLHRALVATDSVRESSVLSGTVEWVASGSRHADNAADVEVAFEPHFSATPLLATRLLRYEVAGPRLCERAPITQSKVDPTPTGFVIRITLDARCQLRSFTSDWIAFEVEPSSASSDLPPKWSSEKR